MQSTLSVRVLKHDISSNASFIHFSSYQTPEVGGSVISSMEIPPGNLVRKLGAFVTGGEAVDGLWFEEQQNKVPRVTEPCTGRVQRGRGVELWFWLGHRGCLRNDSLARRSAGRAMRGCDTKPMVRLHGEGLRACLEPWDCSESKVKFLFENEHFST